MKLDANGNHIFSKSLGQDQMAHRRGYGVAFDPCDQSLVVTGTADKNVDFGDGLTSGHSSLFVARYAPAGALVWAKRFGTAVAGPGVPSIRMPEEQASASTARGTRSFPES